MSQNIKRRVLPSGEMRDYRPPTAHRAISRACTTRQASLDGSSHSGRRSFAAKVLKAPRSLDTVATLLGHNEIDVSARYVDIDPKIIGAIFENAV